MCLPMICLIHSVKLKHHQPTVLNYFSFISKSNLFTKDQHLLLGVNCFYYRWFECVAYCTVGIRKDQTDSHVMSQASPTGGSKQLTSVSQSVRELQSKREI